jgi:hypothetical protein
VEIGNRSPHFRKRADGIRTDAHFSRLMVICCDAA